MEVLGLDSWLYHFQAKAVFTDGSGKEAVAHPTPRPQDLKTQTPMGHRQLGIVTNPMLFYLCVCACGFIITSHCLVVRFLLHII